MGDERIAQKDDIGEGSDDLSMVPSSVTKRRCSNFAKRSACRKEVEGCETPQNKQAVGEETAIKEPEEFPYVSDGGEGHYELSSNSFASLASSDTEGELEDFVRAQMDIVNGYSDKVQQLVKGLQELRA